MMCFSVTVSTFKVYVTTVMNKLTHVSFHKVGREQPLAEVCTVLQFCCKFTSVSVCQKLSKYGLMWFCNVIAKKQKGAFFASQCILREYSVSLLF